MKNIKELNSKIWYRLLKVTYILIFMLLLLFNTIIYKEFTVEQKIETAKNNEKTQDDFQNSFNEARASIKFTDLSDNEIIDWLLNSYKSKWYTIKWVDIDKELWIITSQKDNFISKQKLSELLTQLWPDVNQRWVALQLIDNWYTIEGLENYNPPELQKETKEIETTKLNMWFYSYSIILWKMFLYSFILYLIFFQLINRTFYYIVIWNFKPK